MAINLSNVDFSLEQIIGADYPLILLHSKDWFEYKDGKKTDTRLGTRYEVVQDGGDFQRFTVKCEDSESAVLEDEIEASKDKVTVSFDNARCRLYVDDSRHIQISVKAKAINVL